MLKKVLEEHVEEEILLLLSLENVICCLTQTTSLVLLMVKFVSLDYWYQIYLLFNCFSLFFYIFLSLLCYVGSRFLCMYT